MNVIIDIKVKSIHEIEYFVDNLGWLTKEGTIQLVNVNRFYAIFNNERDVTKWDHKSH